MAVPAFHNSHFRLTQCLEMPYLVSRALNRPVDHCTCSNAHHVHGSHSATVYTYILYYRFGCLSSIRRAPGRSRATDVQLTGGSIIILGSKDITIATSRGHGWTVLSLQAFLLEMGAVSPVRLVPCLAMPIYNMFAADLCSSGCRPHLSPPLILRY